MRNAGRGDLAIRSAQRYGDADPKVEAWRRGQVVPPDTVYDMGRWSAGARKAAWFLPDGLSVGAIALAMPDFSDYSRLRWLFSPSSTSEGLGTATEPWVAVDVADRNDPPPWEDGRVQRGVHAAYMRNAGRVANPGEDQRARELERRAALGDQEAAAQLAALRLRAPATPEEAATAADPVQQAWTAWQQGYGSLEGYQRARFAGIVGASEEEWSSEPGLARVRLYRDHPDTAQSLGISYVGESSPAARAITLDTPQADAVLAAVTAAWARPWQGALTMRGWRKKPTVAQATAIVRAYYLSLGYREDAHMPGTTSGRKIAARPLVSPDGMQRVVFSRTTLQRQYREPLSSIGPSARSGWYRDYKKDPSDQVGVIALAEALVRRAIRAKDWRANPGPDERARRAERDEDPATALREAIRAGHVIPPVKESQGYAADMGPLQEADFNLGGEVIGVQRLAYERSGAGVRVDFWREGRALPARGGREWSYWETVNSRPRAGWPWWSSEGVQARLRELSSAPRQPNPWITTGANKFPEWRDARVDVYREGFAGAIWEWVFADWGPEEAEKPTSVRQALRQAVEAWTKDPMASPGDRVVVTFGQERDEYVIAADGSLVRRGA